MAFQKGIATFQTGFTRLASECPLVYMQCNINTPKGDSPVSSLDFLNFKFLINLDSDISEHYNEGRKELQSNVNAESQHCRSSLVSYKI